MGVELGRRFYLVGDGPNGSTTGFVVLAEWIGLETGGRDVFIVFHFGISQFRFGILAWLGDTVGLIFISGPRRVCAAPT